MDSNQLMAARSFLSPLLDKNSLFAFFFYFFSFHLPNFVFQVLCSSLLLLLIRPVTFPSLFIPHSQKINRNRSFSLLLFWFSSSLSFSPRWSSATSSQVFLALALALRRALLAMCIHKRPVEAGFFLLSLLMVFRALENWFLLHCCSQHIMIFACVKSRDPTIWLYGSGRARSSPIKCFSVSNSFLWFTFDFNILQKFQCDLLH